MSFLYGNHVLKAGVGRVTDGVQQHCGVVVVNMADVRALTIPSILHLNRIPVPKRTRCRCPSALASCPNPALKSAASAQPTSLCCTRRTSESFCAMKTQVRGGTAHFPDAATTTVSAACLFSIFYFVFAGFATGGKLVQGQASGGDGSGSDNTLVRRAKRLGAARLPPPQKRAKAGNSKNKKSND